MQFHTVTAAQFKCDIVAGRGVGMMVISGTVMPGDIRPLGYDGHRHRDSGRMIILVPLSDPAYNRHRKNADGQYNKNHDVSYSCRTL